MDQLPNNVIDIVVDHVRNSRDLLSLAATSKRFNFFATEALYRNILVKEKRKMLEPFFAVNGEFYTIVEPERLHMLLRALSGGRAPLVRRMEICTMCDLGILVQITRLLVDNKAKHASYPLQYLSEFNCRIPSLSFLRLLKDAAPELVESPGLLYENDDYFTPHKVSFPTMESYEIMDLEEMRNLPTDIALELAICLEPSLGTPMLQCPLPELSNLPIRSLLFRDARSMESFFGTMEQSDHQMSLPYLKRLGLTMSSIEQLQSASKFISFSQVKHLELRSTKSRVTLYDEPYNVSALPMWNASLGENIESLSLVNLNSNNLLSNFSAGSRNVFKECNLFYMLMRHCRIFNDPEAAANVKFVNICLNSFAVLPKFSMDPGDYKSAFIVDEEYLNNKLQLFERLFNFENCETLLIPDYLFNWRPFLKFTASGVTTNDQFGDGLFGRDDDFSFYNFIILPLYRRIPDLMDHFGLTVLDLPFDNTASSAMRCHYSGGQVHDLIQLILDNLVVDLAVIAHRLPKLKLLCLGGLLFYIDGHVAAAPHDGWRAELPTVTE